MRRGREGRKRERERGGGSKKLKVWRQDDVDLIRVW